jgi:hypothetical protein
MDILFDIVIPVGPNDIETIGNMIKYTKKNIIGYRNIYIISYDPNIIIDDCIIIDENIFPFNKNILESYLPFKTNRIGWYLQQLLKLYAGFHIPNILNNYLVIDSDTFFLSPTTFFEDKLPLYNVGTEYNIPYFYHMYRMHPSLLKKTKHSGICHHMMFQKHIILELFNLIEKYTNNEFWKSFILLLDPSHIEGSGASEYEIYFNYLLIYHKDKMKIRQLKWDNRSEFVEDNELNYISCHWYMK